MDELVTEVVIKKRKPEVAEVKEIPVEKKETKKAKPKTPSADELKRIEIIFSQAVEEDFLEEFKKRKIGLHYSKISNVTGAGFSNPKLGDAIWPQTNEIIIVYCKNEEAEEIITLVKQLRDHYPAEGIACFITTAEMF